MVDIDNDGHGEYGTFKELAGGDQRRLNKPMEFPLLSGAFTKEDATGLLLRSGYYYQIFLPDEANRAERRYVAIAWPSSYGNSGSRCFYVDETGDVYAASNEGWRYSGPAKRPTPEILNRSQFHVIN